MISVLMPIYNGIEFFHESFASIKHQSFSKWELLIGINGHKKTDSSIKTISKVIAKDPRIKIFDYNFAGKSKTLNHLVKEASYEWIALLDVDDLWYPKKLELQIAITKDYDVIGTFCEYFGDIKGTPKIQKGKISAKVLLDYNSIINSSVLLKKELCYWDESMDLLEDYDLWLRLMAQGCSFFNLSKVLTKHRIHKTSHFNNDLRQEQIKRDLLLKYKKIFLQEKITDNRKSIFKRLFSL